MTYSGEENEPQSPAVPPAHEGVVLPSADLRHGESYGGQPWPPHHHTAPAEGQPWGTPWGPDAAPGGAPAAQPNGPYPPGASPYQPSAPVPPAQSVPPPPQQLSTAPGGLVPYQPQPGEPAPYQVGQPAPGQRPGGQPRPSEETTVLRPVGHRPAPNALPPATDPGDAEATQLIPPMGALPPEGGPGPMPPGASQPVPPSSPLPPENARPAESPAESTTQLRRPIPPAGPLPPAGGAGEETQVLPGPIPAGGPPPYPAASGAPGRTPPSDFDGLFRAQPSAGPPGPADATQQLPFYGDRPPGPGGYPPHGGPAESYPPQGPGGPVGPPPPGGGGRRRSPAIVIGVVVAVCAVAGLTAGAMLSGGGDDKKDDSGAAASSPPADTDKKTSAPPVDPAESQAKSLDSLLAESNNSRDAVIRSVGNIKDCKDLGQAATDLRSAASQRGDLVTRLDELTLDELPNSAKLTASLTKAWKSSQAADNHYAAWADQAGKKKGCQKGHARNTDELAAGNKASGEATAAKNEASKLWNSIAGKYSLTKRKPGQL